MGKNRRNGERIKRSKTFRQRIPKLGYYLIVTDASKTEQNYMYGLRDSIPENLKGKIVIKVSKTETKNLVSEAMNLAATQPQYAEPWIIFDKDEVTDFDKIISEAEKKQINVGWSNPCIETWFSAYFGTMPIHTSSVECCKAFRTKYKNITGKKYLKSCNDIYTFLNKYGDEENAIDLAQNRITQYMNNAKNCKPSDMCSATKIFLLIKEIKSKINCAQE